MVDPEIRDGDRIAELLAAEIEGFEDSPFDAMGVVYSGETGTAADPDGSVYTVTVDGETLFETMVQEDRIYLEFRRLQAEIADAAEAEGLRVRPKATRPPATLVFVERGADVKRVIDVLRECLPPQ